MGVRKTFPDREMAICGTGVPGHLVTVSRLVIGPQIAGRPFAPHRGKRATGVYG
ncbi:hypothetical protein MNBD_ACTINO02-1172 [hydrothermal vent metagenome]|uniref:Uncharacterized protein n=1 Tax=hydrothermal vent metagenome TaxID=652676 RepID=A0A3B0THG4_9ZZZZ